MPERSPSGPGVHYPPPLLFALGLAGGWLLDRAVALPLAPPAARPIVALAGWLLLAGGVALSAWAVATFRGARTSIIPNRPASRLVVHGPFRFSRNPMYAGLTLLYLGAVCLLDSLWPLLLLPAVIALLHLTVIRLEERYLGAAFGAAYDAYRRRVRRWV